MSQKIQEKVHSCPTPYGKGMVDVCIGRELLFDYDVNEKFSPSLQRQMNHENLGLVGNGETRETVREPNLKRLVV